MPRVQITTLQRGQLSVSCQDVSVTQRLVISRGDPDAAAWDAAHRLGDWLPDPDGRGGRKLFSSV